MFTAELQRSKIYWFKFTKTNKKRNNKPQSELINTINMLHVLNKNRIRLTDTQNFIFSLRRMVKRYFKSQIQWYQEDTTVDDESEQSHWNPEGVHLLACIDLFSTSEILLKWQWRTSNQFCQPVSFFLTLIVHLTCTWPLIYKLE